MSGHVRGYRSSGDEARRVNPVCDECDHAWPCDTAKMAAHYSDALDEIYRLRALLAYEAEGIRVHAEYKTFPRSRRKVADAQVERMTKAARGESELVTAGMRHLQQVLINAGAKPTLTRWQWEERRDA